MTTAPIRIAPSTAAYQAGTRGSMTKTRSPGRRPASSSARAARRDSRGEVAAVCSATVSPAAVERHQRELVRRLGAPTARRCRRSG